MISFRTALIFVFIPLMLIMNVQSKSCGSSNPAKSSRANANQAAQPALAEPKASPDKPTPTPPKIKDENVNEPTDEKKSNKQREVPLGIWGGQHIRLIVREDGGDLEYDCAHGTIDGKLSLDAEGKFSLTGTHTREGPGPIRMGVPRPIWPARYSGVVSGDQMSLTVSATDPEQDLGSFKLTRGGGGRLIKCK